MGSMDVVQTERASEIAKRVEEFVRTVVVPYERDARGGSHGPSEELVRGLRACLRRIFFPAVTISRSLKPQPS